MGGSPIEVSGGLLGGQWVGRVPYLWSQGLLGSAETLWALASRVTRSLCRRRVQSVSCLRREECVRRVLCCVLCVCVPGCSCLSSCDKGACSSRPVVAPSSAQGPVKDQQRGRQGMGEESERRAAFERSVCWCPQSLQVAGCREEEENGPSPSGPWTWRGRESLGVLLWVARPGWEGSAVRLLPSLHQHAPFGVWRCLKFWARLCRRARESSVGSATACRAAVYSVIGWEGAVLAGSEAGRQASL